MVKGGGFLKPLRGFSERFFVLINLSIRIVLLGGNFRLVNSKIKTPCQKWQGFFLE